MGKKLGEFNIQNVKYALKNINGGYDAPVAFDTFAQSMSKEANFDVLDLYGDGRLQARLPNDKGLTGNLGLMAVSENYEKAMGRLIEVEGGLAEIVQTSIVEHALYIEVNYAEKDEPVKIAKCWYYGVTSEKADGNIQQNTDSPNINGIEYPITISGTRLKKADGFTDARDTKTGNYIYVLKMTSFPNDDGYDTFEYAVPIPKEKAVSE